MPNLPSDDDSVADSQDGSPDESISGSIPPSSRKQVDEENEAEIPDTQKSNPRRSRGAVPEVEAAQAETESESGVKDDEGDVGEDDEEEGGDEEGPDEYVVEAIVGHKFNRGQLLYHTKWQGWSEDDNTWEPKGNLLPGAAQILKSYHLTIGGEPTKSRGKKGANGRATGEPSNPTTGKRKSMASLNDSASDYKRPRSDLDPDALDNFYLAPPGYVPSKASWDSEVAEIRTISSDPETKQLYAYILWTNGKRTRVAIDKVYKHCPLPMLKFYQAHLKFN